MVVGTRRRRQEQNLSFVEEDPSTGPCRFFGVNRIVGPLVMERRSIRWGSRCGYFWRSYAWNERAPLTGCMRAAADCTCKLAYQPHRAGRAQNASRGSSSDWTGSINGPKRRRGQRAVRRAAARLKKGRSETPLQQQTLPLSLIGQGKRLTSGSLMRSFRYGAVFEVGRVVGRKGNKVVERYGRRTNIDLCRKAGTRR